MYEWDADDYDRNSGAQLLWARELIDKLALAGHESVLDLGCGDGKVTAELAARLPRGSVVGIDSSEQMVALASRYARTLDNMAVRRADARSLPFEAQFDVVFSNAVLHWIRDHRPALAAISRSLRPGGRILLQMGGHGNAADVLCAIDMVARRSEWAPDFAGMEFPYGFHAPGSYEGWLRDAGLEPRRVELLPKDMVHDGPEGLAGWLRTTWLPFTERVEAGRRKEFVDAIVDSYLTLVPADADGRTHVRMVRLEVEATRG